MGDRFWANFKNTAILYGIAPTIVDYLTFYCPVLAGSTENQLNHSVRTMSTFALDKTEEAMVAANIARVLAEVKCMARGIWHFALFLPALQLSAKGMKHFSY